MPHSVFMGNLQGTEGIEKNTTKGGMQYVVVPKDRGPILKLVRERVVTAWAKRAGPQAKSDWNKALGPITGFQIP